MPIQTGDIKLLECDTMDDTAQGGGAMTGTVIADGVSNNIFEDINALDRVYGAVHMRKVFPAVKIQTQDKYFGAHVIISKLPGDAQIGVNLFNTDNWFDRRPVAQSRVENYRARGAAYHGHLYGTQWKDGQIVRIYQRTEAEVPGVGDVLYLSNVAGTEFQYIRITEVSMIDTPFTDVVGNVSYDYTRTIVTLTISQPLLFDFVGGNATRYEPTDRDALIDTTTVANAAKYYSARPLITAGVTADTSIKVDSVYSQIIPSASTSIFIADADMNGVCSPIIDSAQGLVSFGEHLGNGTAFYTNEQYAIYLGSACLPGSLSMPTHVGICVDVDGTLSIDSSVIGAIDYAQGILTIDITDSAWGAIVIGSNYGNLVFRPAATPVKIADTAMLEVTDANRDSTWITTLSPVPLPGSTRVSFMALGEWYTLYDDATGGLHALEEGVGSGTVNYATGTVTLTTLALPDTDSAIIFTSGKQARYFNRSDFTPGAVVIKATLTQLPVTPATLVLTWNDGTARTASADADGIITGDATGILRHNTGYVEIKPNIIPLDGQVLTADYTYGIITGGASAGKSQTFNSPVVTGSTVTLLVSDTDLTPGSIELQWNVQPPETGYELELLNANTSFNATAQARDNGSGGITSPAAGSTVNYATGSITLNTEQAITLKRPVDTIPPKTLRRLRRGGFMSNRYGATVYDQSTAWAKKTPRSVSGYTNTNLNGKIPNDGSVTVLYKVDEVAPPSPPAQQDLIATSSTEVDLTNQFDEAIVPGSVRFTLGGDIYVDREGRLYSNIDGATNAGIDSGTIDYTTGKITLTSIPEGAANSISLESLTTEAGKEPVAEVAFRIPNAPVKVDSVQLRAQLEDGSNITITPDSSGYINTADAQGWCNYSTGVIDVEFGSWTIAAGNEGEDWYDVDLIDPNGEIFVSSRVWADTMLYNAISQTFLPLDADKLGLDPVRLPQDGRVPIYRPGDVVVILNNQTTSGTYVDATQTDLGRGRLAKLNVKDSAGQEILNTRYTADLDVGTIDWVDLSGVAQPLTIIDRIEDMALLSDVQITGKLSLTQPLTHDFPIADTLVANAVVYGDLFAHTSIPFDQQTWTGAWSDILIGSAVAAQYNNSQYPITIDNASGIQERWMILFTSATLVNVIGENTGQILTGVAIAADIAPVNPNTSQPYFTIPLGGWGSGWAAGNLIRFNTIAANSPLWIIQSIGQGDATDDDFTFCIEVRGDIDTP